jgi:hypothetical protein
MMNWIEYLKIEVTPNKTFLNIIEEDSSVKNDMTKIIDPTMGRTKGRPL